MFPVRHGCRSSSISMEKTKNKKQKKSTPNTDRGFTLLETLVWITVFLYVMIAIMSSVMSFYRTNSYAVEQSSAVTSGQKGVEEMIRVIREAAYASDGAYPIIALDPNQISFYADIDSDPFIEEVRYFIQTGSLMRGVVEPTGDPAAYTGSETVSIVSDNIRNVEKGVSMFQFYDKDGVLMADLTKVVDVRFVEATLIVNVNPNRLPNQFTLRSTAALRNLK